MSCELAPDVIHGYLDGELDAARAAEFERHLEGCAECVAELEKLESLRGEIKRAELYAAAPESLRKKVMEDIGSSQRRVARFPRVASWGWLPVAAGLLLAVLGGWYLLGGMRGSRTEEILAAQILDAHLRALQPGHLEDVISTDQHTVKPWFDGRLDFSPPVKDFAEEGFPLEGGRLDVVNGRNVAVLVYGRRKHVINVFVWPAQEGDARAMTGERRGYHWLHWRKDGMEMWAISDVNPEDLAELQRLMK